MKFCECGCGTKIKAVRSDGKEHRFVNGHTTKGKKFTEEHKMKLSISNMHPKSSSTFIQRNREARLHNWQDPEYRKHMSNVHKGKAGYWNGKKRSPETIEKIRKKAKERMSNPEYVLMIARRLNLKPNSHEAYITGLLETNFPKQWIYTGDWKVRIGGHNPDFIHISRKLIIEYDGFYMHKYRIQQDLERNRKYEAEGYKVLVLNEKDKNNPKQLVDKVRAFIS